MPQHYSHAAIAEAIIDLKASASNDVLTAAKDLTETFKARFPIEVPLHAYQMQFQTNPLAPNFASGVAQAGIRLETKDHDRVLQLQRTGFTYSHMPPYSSWRKFRIEAEELWSSFRNAAGITTVTRCAVRVINRFELPGAMSSLPEFLRLLPATPNSLAFNSCFMQLNFPLKQIDAEGSASFKWELGSSILRNLS